MNNVEVSQGFTQSFMSDAESLLIGAILICLVVFFTWRQVKEPSRKKPRK